MKAIHLFPLTAFCLVFQLSSTPLQAFDLISADDDEAQGNRESVRPNVSGDGRYVVFHTESQLLPEDDNDDTDIYWRDRQTRELRLISKNADGVVGDGLSSFPVISADGQYVAFHSAAENLVTDDGNARFDVFVYNVDSGELIMVSRTPTGESGNASSTRPSISADGSIIAFQSQANNFSPLDTSPDHDVYARKLTKDDSIQLVSVNASDQKGNDTDQQPVVSGNGKYVAFSSMSDNLHPHDTDGTLDVFLYSLETGDLELVSYNSEDTASGNQDSQRPSLDETGRLVVFHSTASDISKDDVDATSDVFFRDMDAVTPENILVSVNSAGEKSNQTSTSEVASLSSDGRFVGFASRATNFGASNDNAGFTANHIYLRDLESEETFWLTETSEPGGANHNSVNPAISADGGTVVFKSNATNLVDFDENGLTEDIFAAPGTDFTFDREARDAARAAAQKAALRAKLTKKLRKFKKKLRKVRRAKKVARVKAFKKKIRKVKKQLRSL